MADPNKKPFELIYSQQAGDFVAGRAYSNPRFFTTPRQGVDKVLLVGEWPNIREAYEAIGVEVEQIDEHRVRGEGNPPSPEAPVSLAPPAPDARAGVEIPANWADLPWTGKAGALTLRGLASRVSETPVLNKDQAVAAIQAEIARRSAAQADQEAGEGEGSGEGEKAATGENSGASGEAE